MIDFVRKSRSQSVCESNGETRDFALGGDVNITDSTLTVYYDGACPLCRREIGYYRRQRGAEQIDWVDVSGENAGPVAPDLCRADALARFHVRLPGGQLADGAAGFAAMWRALPGWRWLGRIASAPGVGALLEMSYRSFLKLRPTMQRLACALDAKAQRRQDSVP